MDDVLRSGVPLKIHFTTLAVSRNDPAEEVFVSMLLNHSQRMRSITEEPIAIPIFGRGRVLEGMIGKDITLEHTLGASSYLCSACSCQVKEENPGMDMLMAVKWADHMLGSLIIEDRILPPLEGIAEVIKAAPELPAAVESRDVVTGNDETEEGSSISIGLIVVLSALAILVFSIFSFQAAKPT